MPVERPGRGFYVPAATKVHLHNEPCTENGRVGAAVKQRANPVTEGLATVQTIKVGEPFHIRTKGVKEFSTAAGSKGAALAGAVLGQGVYIRPADDTLRLQGATAVGDLPFGRVHELPGGNRGVSPNKIRIDLDEKDTLAAA